jgi:hypothetical protein
MPRIGELLVSLGACSPQAIQDALQNQAFFGARLGTNLLQMGAVRESQLADALQRLHGIPCVCGDVPSEPEAIALVRRALVEEYEAVPYMTAGTRLAVLARDPGDLALDHLAFATGKKIFPFVVAEARLWALMRKHYGIERGLRGIDIDAATSCLPGAAATAEQHVAGDLMDEHDFMSMYGSCSSPSQQTSIARIARTGSAAATRQRVGCGEGA